MSNKPYKLSELASSELNQIFDYQSEIDFESAIKLMREFNEKFVLLAQNPAAGRRRDEIIINLRSFPAKKYNIYYFPTAQGVEIYRVLHSSQNIEKVFDKQFEGLSE